jgi:beta/gamma crystallin/glycine zipper 2TM protein
MSFSLKAAMGIAGLAIATTAAAQVTLYSHDDFRGRQFTANGTVRNLDRTGFNDRASSVIVNGGNWQVCSDAYFNGHCVILQPGEYPSLDQFGLENRISSIRPVGERYGYNGYDRDRAYVAERGGYDWHRREGERLFEAPVTSVHAVVGPPEQRCWVEPGQISDANVPGAIAGAVIGGILGHQIGNGHGRDAATAGGAVAGAALGANIGGGGTYYGDVQRCASVPSSEQPDYFDVTYSFRGIVHHVQMTSPPGPTITVNRDGEPRE